MTRSVVQLRAAVERFLAEYDSSESAAAGEAEPAAGECEELVTEGSKNQIDEEQQENELRRAAHGCLSSAGLRVVAVDYVESVVERMATKYAAEAVEWIAADLTIQFEQFLGVQAGLDLIVDKGCLDALLVKPVELRTSEDDTWVTDPEDPSAASALAYLINCSLCLQSLGGRMLLVTVGSRQNREPLMRQAGLEIISFEDMPSVTHEVVRLVYARPQAKA